MSELKWRTEKTLILQDIQKRYNEFFKSIDDIDVRIRYKQHFVDISVVFFDDSVTDDKLSEAIESFGILVYCGGQDYMRLGGCLISPFVKILSFPSAPPTLKRMVLEGLASICWLRFENQEEFIKSNGGKVLMRKISERENPVLCRWSSYLLVVLLAGGTKIIQEFKTIPLFRQILLATAEDHFIWNVKGWPCNHAELAFRILFGYFPDPFSSSNLIAQSGSDRQADQSNLQILLDGLMTRTPDVDEAFKNITPQQALQVIIDHNTTMMKALLQQVQQNPTANTEIIQALGGVQAQAHLLHTIQATMALTFRQVEDILTRGSSHQSRRSSGSGVIFPQEVASLNTPVKMGSRGPIQHSRRSVLHPKHMAQSFQLTMRSRESEDLEPSGKLLLPTRAVQSVRLVPEDEYSDSD